MSTPGAPPARRRSGRVSAGVAFAGGLLLMLMLGMGIISDCQSDPLCTGSCQDDCNALFYRHYALAAAFVTVVAVVATKRFGTRAWQLIGVATVVASINLVIFR